MSTGGSSDCLVTAPGKTATYRANAQAPFQHSADAWRSAKGNSRTDSQRKPTPTGASRYSCELVIEKIEHRPHCDRRGWRSAHHRN